MEGYSNNLRSKNPNDDSISSQCTKHEDDVKKSKRVLKERIWLFKGFPVWMDISQIAVQKNNKKLRLPLSEIIVDLKKTNLWSMDN